MRLDADDLTDLRPLLVETVKAVLVEVAAADAKLNGRVGYPEAEAASLLGIERYTLRDCRLRGEISAKKVGKRWVYSRETLAQFLVRD